VVQLGHNPVHGLELLGQQAAHVIVHAPDMGDGLQSAAQGQGKFALVHGRAESAGAQGQLSGIGHGCVQHDFFLARVCFFSQHRGVTPEGQECQGQRLIQSDQAFTLNSIVPHVINDDRDGGRHLPLADRFLAGQHWHDACDRD
jgi:hypothetical protein